MNALVLVEIQTNLVPGGAPAVPQGNAVVPVVNRLQPACDPVNAPPDRHPANHGSFAAQHTRGAALMPALHTHRFATDVTAKKLGEKLCH